MIAATLLVVNLLGQQLPVTPIKDVATGKKVPFNELCAKGKVTLITFWGTWCAHGKREVKTIAAKLPEWRKQANFDFIAIAAHEQHSEQFVNVFVTQQRWKFPCYVDVRADLGGSFDLKALPLTLIVDQKGKVVFTHTGYDNGKDIIGRLKQICGTSHTRK